MTGGTHMPGAPDIPFHPLANLFPMLSDADLDELGADMAQNGQAETIKLHKGMLLDGRNRYTAAIRKALPIRFENFSGTDRDALNWVISKNLRRRHLSEGQRAAVAAKIGRLRLGDNQHTSQPAQICAPSLDLGDDSQPAEPPAPAMSQAERADMLNVSRRSVQHADTVFEKGAPELQAAMESGKVAASTAADLSELPKEQQAQVAKMSEKEILAEASRLRKAKNEKRRAERVDQLKRQAAGNTPLTTVQKFPVIYMDPPTKFAAGDSDRSTENHYPTMTEEELAKLPIGELATDDAVLFVWTTVPWLRKTIRLIESWGFEYVSEFVWDKRAAGMGFWNRNRHENLLIATRGKMPAPSPTELEPSLYPEERGTHSAKPAYFREVIARYYPDLPKVELFARGDLPKNWTSWGNEARAMKQRALDLEQHAEAAE